MEETESRPTPETGQEDTGAGVHDTAGTQPSDTPSGQAAPAERRADARPAERTKTSVLERSIAKFIDVLLALLLAQLPGYVGFLAGLTYIGIADGLMGGRSIGKRIIGLRVVAGPEGLPADFRASLIRNITIAACYLLYHIPVVGIILGAAGMGLELLILFGSQSGHRIGDELAATDVVPDKTAPGVWL